MNITPRNVKNPFISACIPAYNEGKMIAKFLTELAKTLAKLTNKYEIIVVDDGSADNSAATIKTLIEQGLPIKLIEFSRNFGKEKAIGAALDHTSGDAVLLMDSDFQHPLNMIPKMLKKWQAGYDNIYGIRKSRKDQGFITAFFSRCFYQFTHYIMDIKLPTNASDFRMFDKRLINALIALPEKNRFMKGLYAWVGFNGCGIEYQPDARAEGKSRLNILKLFNLAITGITSFSDWPLRLVAFAGALISLISIIYGLYVVLDTLVGGNSVPGWSTTVVAIMFLGGIQLISLGIIGEYIAKIYNEVKNRPNYIIKEKTGFSSIKKPISKKTTTKKTT